MLDHITLNVIDMSWAGEDDVFGIHLSPSWKIKLVLQTEKKMHIQLTYMNLDSAFYFIYELNF